MIAARAHEHRGWADEADSCPACLQEQLLHTLLESGDDALHRRIQDVWPIDAEAAFGALPTPLRLHADPRYTGRGVTMAMIDSAFYPHPDLVWPANRIRAWVDATRDPVEALTFGPERVPRWPDWDLGRPAQWHGLMTSAAAAGNGWLSHGLYRGLASGADLVLIQTQDERGQITNAAITRAMHWLRVHGPALGVRVVNLSVGGDPVRRLDGNPVDQAVAALVAKGMVVVAAAGNDGRRSLLPPATAPEALTVGGLDDKNGFDHTQVELWHGNYGATVEGAGKPELVAPSIWVVAPLLPGSELAAQAGSWFARRGIGDAMVEGSIAANKLVTKHYQHVDGTSFAAPLVASVAACMLQANPALTPAQVRWLLIAAAQPIPGAPVERQGAGAIHAGQAVALALAFGRLFLAQAARAPWEASATTFLYYDPRASQVAVFGAWNGWHGPGLPAMQLAPGLWLASGQLRPGRYGYKFLVDGGRWQDDPANPRKLPDGHGGLNSLLRVRAATGSAPEYSDP